MTPGSPTLANCPQVFSPFTSEIQVFHVRAQLPICNRRERGKAQLHVA